MMQRIFKLTSLTLSLTLLLSGCSASKGPQADHKPATSACLMTTQSNIPGTPDKQLAADLVQAQVVYGIRVKEVAIPKYADEMSRLLKALQNGCVLMVSSDPSLLDSLSSFAKLHSKMMVLFVGSSIAEVDQAKNFRWIADDISSGAKLAGYAVASLGGEVNLFIQENYFQAKEIQTGFQAGVDYYNQQSNSSVKLVISVVSSKDNLTKKLQALVEPSVVALFAGKSYWSALDSTEHQVIGADLQFGDTRETLNSQLVGSLERNTSLEVLRAVSSLLARKISSLPSYRKNNALKAGRILMKVNDGVAPGLADYQSQLLQELK